MTESEFSEAVGAGIRMVPGRKARAAAWFEALRDDICAAFEALEDAQDTGPFAGLPAGRFERKETHRAGEGDEDAGGGVMSVMREGRVFEKVGVNISTVYGTLGDLARRSLTARKSIPGLDDDPVDSLITGQIVPAFPGGPKDKTEVMYIPVKLARFYKQGVVFGR